MIKSIKKAGAPDVGERQQDPEEGHRGLPVGRRTCSPRRKTDAANLSTTDPTSFVTDATKIETDLNGASDAFQTNFSKAQELDKKGKIGLALTKAKACKFLTG